VTEVAGRGHVRLGKGVELKEKPRTNAFAVKGAAPLAEFIDMAGPAVFGLQVFCGE